MLNLDWSDYVFALLIVFAVFGVNNHLVGASSALWNGLSCNYKHPIEGVITEAELDHVGKYHSVEVAAVKYTYEYNSKFFIGSTVSLTTKSDSPEQVVAKFHQGDNVKVVIDPSKPSCSVLEVGPISGEVYKQLLLSFVCSLVLCIIFLWKVGPR